MHEATVALAALPGYLRAPQPAPRPGRRAASGSRRKRLPRGPARGGDEGGDNGKGAGPQPGARAIAIEDLFAPGVYAGKVQA
eukprot:3080202-Pleurochrysis_carterae.AAC.1